MARASPVAASVTRPGGDTQSRPRAFFPGDSDGLAGWPGTRALRVPASAVTACRVTGRAPLELQAFCGGSPVPTKRGKHSTHSNQGLGTVVTARRAVHGYGFFQGLLRYSLNAAFCSVVAVPRGLNKIWALCQKYAIKTDHERRARDHIE